MFDGGSLVYLLDNFVLDEDNFTLTQEGRRVALEPKSLRVLILLVRAKGKLVSKNALLEEVWSGTFVEETTLTRAIALLRKQLGDDRRNPRFIETVPTIGYRFMAQVVERVAHDAIPVAPVAVVEIENSGPPAPEKSTKAAWRRWIWIGSTVLALALIASVGMEWHRRQTPKIHSVAVMPLRNLSSDPNMEYFAEGMTDELITELGMIPELRVVSHTSVILEKGNRDSLSQIARRLGVDAIVEGSAVRENDKIRLDIRLIDGRSDRQLWAGRFEDATADVLALQKHVAMEIAAHTEVLLTPPTQARLGGTQRIDPAAYDGYLQGRYLLNKRDSDGAVLMLRHAVALDPAYARAWAGLAAALADSAMESPDPLSGPVREASAAAKHAIELDPQNGEAWSVLGTIAYCWEWDWKTADRDLQRAIALSPSDSMIELHYATYLSLVGHHDDAVSHMKRALDLDPLSFFNMRQMGSVLYWARRYDEALEYLRRAREMEPELSDFTESWVSSAYEMKGSLDEAVQADLRLTPAPSAWRDRLEKAYRSGGRIAYWETRAKMLRSFPYGASTSWDLATYYARIGKSDEAFDSLNHALNDRCFLMGAVKADPIFDRLRKDSRYENLLKKVHLSE